MWCKCPDKKRKKYLFNPSNDVLSDVLSDVLNDDERMLLGYIVKDPSAKQDWYSRESGFSIAKVQRVMKKLKDKGIIYRSGAKKNGFWVVEGGNDEGGL